LIHQLILTNHRKLAFSLNSKNHRKEKETMPYEILHFRDSDKILKNKKMTKEVKETLDYLQDGLYQRFYKGSLLKSCLEEMGWREEEPLAILEGRRYAYKGLRKRIAIEANLINYEGIQDGLFRLQVGFDQGRIDVGLLFLNSRRSSKSPLGTSLELAKKEVEYLYPTISMPVAIVLFDLGVPQCLNPDETDNKNTDQQSQPQNKITNSEEEAA